MDMSSKEEQQHNGDGSLDHSFPSFLDIGRYGDQMRARLRSRQSRVNGGDSVMSSFWDASDDMVVSTTSSWSP